MRRLSLDYLSFDDQLELGLVSLEDLPDKQLKLIEDAASEPIKEEVKLEFKAETAEPKIASEKEIITTEPKASKIARDGTAPLCFNCGNQTQRAGNCYVCLSCGSTTGCS